MMPIGKKVVDTRRTIEMLREYRDSLTNPPDAGLRHAVDRIIVVFEGNLYKALLDLQRFYEGTLLSDSKSTEQKTQEALRYMYFLEQQRHTKGRSPSTSISQQSLSTTSKEGDRHQIEENGFSFTRPKSTDHLLNGEDSRMPYTAVNKTSPLSTARSEPVSSSPKKMLNNNVASRAVGSPQTSGTDGEQDSGEQETIILHRPHPGAGFGFSIAGGVGNFRGNSVNPCIYVTRVSAYGVAAADGRLRAHDIILAVNGVSVANMAHAQAVEQLKRTGNSLVLLVKHGSASSGHQSSTQSSNMSPIPSASTNSLKQQVMSPSKMSSSVPFSPPPAAHPLAISADSQTPPNKSSSLPRERPVAPINLDQPPDVPRPVGTSNNLSPKPDTFSYSESGETDASESNSEKLSESDDGDSNTHSDSCSEEHDNDKPSINGIRPSNNNYLTEASPKRTPNHNRSLENGSVVQIELVKGPRGLGFSIAGGLGNEHVPEDPGIFISKMMEGGPAAQQGQMRAGDRLIAVNDMPLVNVTHKAAVAALKDAGQRVRLTLVQPASDEQRELYEHGYSAEESDDAGPPPSYSAENSRDSPRPPISPLDANRKVERYRNDNEAKTVVLRRGATGLGFNIVGGELGEGIFISYLQPGGAAANSGSLRVGDQLISVNGIVLTNISHEEAANYLKTAGERVELVAVYRPEDYARYEAKMMEESSSVTSNQPGIHSTPLRGHPFLQARSHPDLASTETSSAPLDYKSSMASTVPEGYATLHRPIVGRDVNNDNNSGSFSPRKASVPSGIAKRFQNRDITGSPSSDGGAQIRSSKSQNNLMDARALVGARKLPKEFFVQALIDYDANKDSGLPSRGLSFRTGDILHIVDAVDDEWWRARLVYLHGGESGTSLIPSHWRVERRERARLKRVNFNGNEGPKSSSNPNLDGADSMSGTTIDERNNDVARRLSGNAKNANTGGTLSRKSSGKSSSGENGSGPIVGALAGSRSRERLDEVDVEKVLTYKRVQRFPAPFKRPVVVMGALKDALHDSLVSMYPDQFRTCVPHTTRPPADNEVHGRDYYFVKRDEMERDIQARRFIEAGQFNGNLYGTSIAAVREVAYGGRHCILDVSMSAIRRLCEAEIQPIVLLVHPRTAEQMKELLISAAELNDIPIDEVSIQKALDRIARQRREGTAFLTGVLHDEVNYDNLCVRLKQVIHDQSEHGIWLTASQQLW